MRLPSFKIGLPNGCCSLDTIEIFKFFQSSTELTEPDTSKIKRLLSDSGIGIPSACAGELTEPKRPEVIVANKIK